ncbi:glycoside hydrolase family 28 protein [bacterium]|nr:glycoside hydrolase family 28 protein [bacterium]
MRQTNRLYISFVVLLALVLAVGCSSVGSLRIGTQAGWRAVPEILSRIVPPQFPDRDYVVTDFGAVADGRTDSRPAFAKAIDQCNAAGGGRVVVPAGRYQIDGPIHLKSNVNLHLKDGACLKFSSNPADYLPVVLTRWEGTELFNYSPLVYVYQATNVAITGKGTLDGNGKACFATWEQIQAQTVKRSRDQNETEVPVSRRIFGEGYYARPNFVQFFGCKNVLVEGVTLVDAPFWVTHFVGCKNVTVRGIRIDSLNGNSDGVDPESTVDMLIEDCDFHCEDDAVAIKSGRDHDAWRLGQPSENIIVRRCKIRTNKSGLCVGSEMGGGARNIFWENCDIEECVNGLYFKGNADRGGVVEDVWVRNIRIGHAAKSAVNATCNYNGAYRGGKHDPLFQRISIANMKIGKTDREGIMFDGRPELPMRQIRFTNVAFEKEGMPSRFVNCDDVVLKNVRVGGQLQPERPASTR